MAEGLTNEQAVELAQLLNDPDKAGELTLAEFKDIRTSLRAFKADRASRIEKLASQGLSGGQAAKVQRAEDVATPGEGSAKISAPPQFAAQDIEMQRATAATREGLMQAVEGIADLGTEIGVALNIVDRDTADDFKAGMAERRLKEKLAAIDKFGEVNPQLVQTVANIAPWVLTAPSAASGLMRLTLQNMMVGAAIGGSVLSKETLNERLAGITLGAGLGAGFSLFALKSFARQRIAKRFAQELNETTAAGNIELEQSIQKMLNDENFSFSLSQITGGRFVFGLEQRSAATLQKEAQNKNIGRLWKNILRTARTFRKAGRDADAIALDIRATLTKANKDIHERASDAFAEGLTAIETKFGDDLVLSIEGGQEYLRKLDGLIDEGRDILVPGGTVTKAFSRYREGIDELVNPVVAVPRTVKTDKGSTVVYDLRNRRTKEIDRVGLSFDDANIEAIIANETRGGFEAGELVRITKGLNSLLRGKTAVLDSPDPGTNKAIAKALMGNLLAVLKTSGKNPEAIAALSALREGYKGEMLLIGDMERLVIARTFGVKNMPSDTDKALDVVLANGKSGLKNVREFLEEWNAPLLDDLRAAVLRRAVRKSVDPGGASVDTAISLTRLADNLSGPEGIGQLAKGLFPPKVQAELLRTGRALRTIKNNYFTGISPTGGVSVDDVAINIISQSPEFMGRFLVRVISGGATTERAMIDPLVRKAIITLAEQGPNSAFGKAAMLTLTHFIVAEDERKAEAKAAEEQAVRQNAITNQGRPTGVR